MAWQAPTVTVTVDSKEYTVDPDKMPYFNSQTTSNHGELKHFDVALLCIEEGFHQAFGAFKADLNPYPVLCATLKRLGVDVLGSYSLAEIIDGLKSFSFDDDESKRESTNLAADSVFRLLYMHHTGVLGSGDRDKVFEAVTYIISHRHFFDHYTRSVVRETYKTMGPTVGQLAIIGKWPVYDSDGKPPQPYVSPDGDHDSGDYYDGNGNGDDYYDYDHNGDDYYDGNDNGDDYYDDNHNGDDYYDDNYY